MIKKKAAKKSAEKKKNAKKRGKKRLKKEINPAEVRKEVSRIVEAEAVEIAQAVVDEAKKGQLAPVRYLFEVANIFPAQTDPEQATEEEDSLAKILLARIEAAPKPEAEDEGESEDAGEEAKKPASTTSDHAEDVKNERAKESVGTATLVT